MAEPFIPKVPVKALVQNKNTIGQLTDTDTNGFNIEHVRAVFDQMFKHAMPYTPLLQKYGWKAPFQIVVTPKAKDICVEAIVFHDADDPAVTQLPNGNYLIVTKGYQAW